MGDGGREGGREGEGTREMGGMCGMYTKPILMSNAGVGWKSRPKPLLKKSSGVIFDFDGLLADSEPYHYLAYNEVFQRYGHSLDKDEYWVEWTSKGKGIAGEIDRHNLHLEVDPIQLRQQKFEVYSQYCQKGAIRLFPESLEIIELLKASYPVAIASGSWKHDIRAILKNAGAEHLFDKILGKEAAKKEKPHP